jgi:hypothetical protein
VNGTIPVVRPVYFAIRNYLFYSNTPRNGEEKKIMSFLDKQRTALRYGKTKKSTAIKTTENTAERKRHGFTTFWLIFGIAISVVFFPSFCAYSLFADYTESAILLLDITCAVDIVAGILLLCWKKIGFTISIVTTSLVVLSDIISGHSIGYMLFNASMLAILFGVLHIRKNGKTAWEQLEWRKTIETPKPSRHQSGRLFFQLAISNEKMFGERCWLKQ